MRVNALCVLVLCCIVWLCACGEDKSTVMYNGRELSDSEIQSMLYRETEQETKPAATLTAYDGKMETPSADSVYWTAGGSVFHFEPSCRHLSGKKVYYGTVENAVSENKKRACTACQKQ